MFKNFLKTGFFISLFASAFAGLNGCSTVASGLDSAGQGVVSVAESVQQGITDVDVKAIEKDQYFLSQTFEEPVTGLDSWAMRIEAREVCPTGYIYLSRNARNSGAFAESTEQCYGDMDCTYKLEWQIQCADVPEEPFSFFGKS